MKRIFLLLAICVVVFFTVQLVHKNAPRTSVEVSREATQTARFIPTSEETSRVTRVIDGDTIVLENGKHVRYIGINTPEMENGACFSRQASDENKKLVEGKTVLLVRDVSETDKYDRLLRYVYVDDLLINDVLVRQGFAKIESIKPDTAFSQRFLSAQQEARGNNRGLWSECPGR